MPKDYREKDIKDLHQSGRKAAVMIATLRLHYTWPNIRADIMKVISSCQACEQMMPEKSAAKGGGLPVSVNNLAPLDWVCTDLMSVQDKKGGQKPDYIIVADGCSGFRWTKKLPSTKT